MQRKERTKVLVHCEEDFLKTWAKKLEKEDVYKTIEKPAQSLTMVKVRESAQNTQFYLCEVLVSEARVECRGQIGIGIIQGNQLNKAYYLAVIDAAYNANISLVQALDSALLKQKEYQDEKYHAQATKILKTKVNFEIMDQE